MLPLNKEFDARNIVKKHINNERRVVYVHAREVWWCAIGVNIGAEVDGKNEHFERPVLVIKVYNRESLFVVPITSRAQENKFHIPIVICSASGAVRTVWVKLTQSRVISTKRLLRKVDVVNRVTFDQVRHAVKRFL
jgi:mRNA-degrading endonuclease toxin of MazEF toxin-antitoxin module